MSFNVKLVASDRVFSVEPEETILDAALRESVGLPYGCRNGQCGSCAAQLVSGQVKYPEGEPPALADVAPGACLCCKAVPASDLELEVRETATAAQIEPRILPVRVVRIDHLADDVIRLYLKLPESQRLQFLAGQYLDFLLSDGERRAFSIANAPHDDELIELHIRHVDGGKFTDWAFTQMAEKAILRIHAPLGAFTLDEDSDRPMIFMGGGTGFAPLKGQIEHAFYHGVDRPMHLYWGARAQPDIYLPDLPEEWAARHENFEFVPVLSEPNPGWGGRTGWVHEAVLADHPDLSGFDLYMAGPPPMIVSARATFTAAGLPPERMFFDSFEYGATSTEKT
jgi:CDP-4-dehydro-6-deoxyglucose reductase